MVLTLRSEHRLHLSVLFGQPVSVLQDFCRLAVDYLKKGTHSKLYSAAAQQLEVSIDTIQLAVEALVFLLVESHRHSVSQSSFRDLVLATGFTEDQQSVLSEFHHNTHADVAKILSFLAPTLVHYHDLEWRFDVQVASRALHHQIIPSIILKLAVEGRPLSTVEESSRRNILLQTDPGNLKHMVERLEHALQEASSQHSRRVQRATK